MLAEGFIIHEKIDQLTVARGLMDPTRKRFCMQRRVFMMSQDFVNWFSGGYSLHNKNSLFGLALTVRAIAQILRAA